MISLLCRTLRSFSSELVPSRSALNLYLCMRLFFPWFLMYLWSTLWEIPGVSYRLLFSKAKKHPRRKKKGEKTTIPTTPNLGGSISLPVVNFVRISSNFSPFFLYLQYIWSFMVCVLSSPFLVKLPGFLNCWLFHWIDLPYFPVELRRSLSVLFSNRNVRQFYLVI